MIEAKHNEVVAWYEENGNKISRDFPIGSKNAQIKFIKDTGVTKFNTENLDKYFSLIFKRVPVADARSEELKVTYNNEPLKEVEAVVNGQPVFEEKKSDTEVSERYYTSEDGDVITVIAD